MIKLLASRLLQHLAATPVARPAVALVARLGRSGLISPGTANHATQVLAEHLDARLRTFDVEIALAGSSVFAVACDLRYHGYRELFFTRQLPAQARLAINLVTRRAPLVDAVVDVGSNVGLFAYAAAAAGARRVEALEPIPRLADLVRDNARANGWAHIVHVHELVAGAEEGTTEFFVLRSDTESTMVPERAASQDVRERIQRQVVRLDRFCERQRIDPSRAMFKIDVEGAETDVIAGLGPLVERADAPELLIELLGRTLQAGAIEQLCGIGYRVHYLAPAGPVRVRTGAEFAPHQHLSSWDFFVTKRELPEF